MPWSPLPRIAVAVATYPFAASSPADLPLEIGDDLYIIEQGGKDGDWYRGYLVAPPSLLSGLTSGKGQTLEARVFSGVFPRCCIEVREHLGDASAAGEVQTQEHSTNSESPRIRQTNGNSPRRRGSSMRRKLPRRTESEASVGNKESGMNGNLGSEPSFSRLDTRSTSQQRSDINGQSLARKLSHRSIASPGFRNSPDPSTPTRDSHLDPTWKRPQAPVPMLKIGDETPTSTAEPLVDEISSCLREWHSKNLHELLLARRYSLLDKVHDLINRLEVARRQLLHGVLTAQELVTLREETIWNLVTGNKLLSNEVIVRDPKGNGRLLNGDDSPFEMSKLQSTMSLLDRPPSFPRDSANVHHLMVELKSFAANGLLSPTLNLYLCAKHQGEVCRTLSESFTVEPPSADLNKSASTRTLRTLFTDITPNDIGDASRPGVELYLVVKVQASQAVKAVSSSPRKDSRNDEDKLRPTTGNAGVPSMKGGRQSIMWAQKQFGSVRNRSQLSAKMNLEMSIAESSPTPSEHSRPDTEESLRPATQQGTQYVKRNVGIGILSLKQIFNQNATGDHSVTIWAPSVLPAYTKDGNWDEVLRELIYSKNGTFNKAKSVDHVSLSLQPFVHAHVDNLVAKTPNLLQSVPITSRLDFPGAPTEIRSDIYIILSEVNLPSQALLSHPERGTVQLSSNTELKNVQVTLEVRRKSGERIENCIIPSSESQPLKAWRSAAVERGEPWNQLIKLSIPEKDVPDAHLIMSIADAPGFPFALGWMPLWTDNAFMKDGPHAPLLYLYDKTTSGSGNGRGAYLDLPWSSKGPYGDEKDESVTGPVATLKLDTKLCSTIFSQDKTLLGVLNWQHQSKAQTLGFVKRYSFVPEIDIVKLIGDVLDALFGILVSNTGEEEHEDSVFAALITTLSIVYDRRFNLEPYVDNYAETRFDHPYATPCLIRAYTRLLADRSNQERSRRVRAAFKVGRHILKFILCAREKQQAKEDGIGATTQSAFKRDLRSLFHAFEDMIKDPAPTLIGNKTLVVQYMPAWLPELKTTFCEEDIMQLAYNFVEACRDVQGKLVLYKLILILKLSDVTLFTQDHVRSRIIESTPAWTRSYWGSHEEITQQWREQTRLCCSVICNQIGQPGFEGLHYIEKVIESYACLSATELQNQGSLSLLFPTTYPFPSKPLAGGIKFDEVLVELGALLTRLAESPLARVVSMSTVETANLISGLLDVITSIISGKAFSRSWLSLFVYHHKSMLQLLEHICDVMISRLVPSPDDADDFNTELWSKYLNTVLMLVRSDILALETFPEQKRRAVWKIAGDVREQGASLLNRSWGAIGWDTSVEDQRRYGLTRLGGFQVQYVPGLVSPIVELCLSVHEGLRGVAIKVLQSMIISEWTLNEDLSVAQAEIIDSLDNIYKTKDVGNNLVQKMFINELLDLFEPVARMPLDPLWQAIRDVVNTMDELLELLSAVHGRDTDESMQVMDTLQLMNFYKELQKEDIFIRYIHQLAGIQNQLHKKTEAGLALQLHAELYTWEQTKLRPLDDPAFPEQTSFERKERLYFDMIQYFEEGAAWDCALASYRELASQYESVYYDFAKLARTQRAMATIYETIAKGEWNPPRYFRVIYHGLGCQANLRDHQFIYEGLPSERQSAFTDRMRQLHPSAQILSKGEPEDMEGQYLQISPVSVYRDLEHPIYQQPKVAQSIREYVTTSRPYRFAVTSKRHSPSSGVQDQWIEKTVIYTREALPTILRRSEIASIETIRLSPLQTAVERTSRKTAELAIFEKRVVNGDDTGFSNLTEAIISSVDPTSAATVAQYRHLLPTQSEEGREEAEEVVLSPPQNALQIALLDHVSTIKHCLTHYTHSSHLGTQTSLFENLNHTFAPELAQLYPESVPALEADFSDMLSSPPQSSAGVSSPAASTLLPLANGYTSDPVSPKSTPAPKPLISFNVLKTSLSNQNQQQQTPFNSLNGSVSAPSESVSTSRSHSQSTNAAAPVTPLRQMSGNANVQLTNINGEKRHASGSDTGEKPDTSQSLRSASTAGGKMKKRLSLLGIGRVGSKLDKDKKGVRSMGIVGEE